VVIRFGLIFLCFPILLAFFIFSYSLENFIKNFESLLEGLIFLKEIICFLKDLNFHQLLLKLKLYQNFQTNFNRNNFIQEF
jgi:hypothetical protein